MRTLLRILLGIEEQEAVRILEGEISTKELEYFLPLVRECLEIEGDLEDEPCWRDFEEGTTGVSHFRKGLIGRVKNGTGIAKSRYGTA